MKQLKVSTSQSLEWRIGDEAGVLAPLKRGCFQLLSNWAVSWDAGKMIQSYTISSSSKYHHHHHHYHHDHGCNHDHDEHDEHLESLTCPPRLMIGLTCFKIQFAVAKHDCQSYATAGSSDNLVDKFPRIHDGMSMNVTGLP